MVLVCAGLKMICLNDMWNGKFPTGIFLLIIGIIFCCFIYDVAVFPQIQFAEWF